MATALQGHGRRQLRLRQPPLCPITPQAPSFGLARQPRPPPASDLQPVFGTAEVQGARVHEPLRSPIWACFGLRTEGRELAPE